MGKITKAYKLIDKLNASGYEAYIVGGYVRDYLLGTENSDIDIATDCTPDKLIDIFDNTVLTGFKHGTVIVIFAGEKFEITTFRTESDYINNRKPEQVYFVSSLAEDIKRRDFTMNALALTKTGKIIDFVGGKEDIKAKLIRTVGDPFARFREDALRMLRAFRFVAALGFAIDAQTLSAIRKQSGLIRNISRERIIKELELLISGKYFLRALKIMISVSFHKEMTVFENGIEKMYQVRFIPENLHEFLSFCAVTGALQEINNLPLSNRLKKAVTNIYEMYNAKITDFTKRILFRNGLENCLLTNKLNVYLRSSNDKQEKIISDYRLLPIHKVSELELNGDDIIKLLPQKPGPWVGEIIDDLCMKVLNKELTNDYQKLKSYLLLKKNK